MSAEEAWAVAHWARVDVSHKARAHWFAAGESRSACGQIDRGLGSWRGGKSKCRNCERTAALS